MDITAVILSAAPVTRDIEGVTVLPHVSQFKDAKGLLAARKDAIQRVTTPWFFFLDDDDELPDDYLRVLDRCMAVPTPLAYTDELIRQTDRLTVLRRSKPYSQDAHILNNCLIHHLAVCRTEAAREALPRVPSGPYGFEPLVWFEVAKQGATYVEEVGYIWNRPNGHGLSRQPGMLRAMVMATHWAHRNRT